MSSVSSLIRWITICGGFPIFVSGTLGNVFNVLILCRTRQNPCAFLFLISSIVNIIVLFYGLLTRILSVGFDLDWSNTNLIWCKTRLAFTQTSFLISLTCSCLASIDRYLVSSREEKYRRLSRLSITKCSILFIILFWLGHSVPYLIYADLITNSSTGVRSCSLVPNPIYANYRTYFVLPFYLGLFPSLILMLTGLMTYSNTNQLRIGRQRQFIQKQLTTMMLIQIPIILVSILPYVIFNEYLAITSTSMKSNSQRSIESLLTNLVTLLFYLTFASPFFVFFISSKSFRQDFKRLIFCQLTINQIQPQTTALQLNTINTK